MSRNFGIGHSFDICLPAAGRDFEIWRQALFIDGFVLFAHESRIEIPWSSTVGNIAGHIAEGAGLLARRTSLRCRISPKSITAIRTFPLCHLYHLPFQCGTRIADFGIECLKLLIISDFRYFYSALRNRCQSSYRFRS